MVGTHDGVLHTPNGDVAPTGRAVELRWAAVYVTDGDTLKSEHLFFDQMDFLGQLGLLPVGAQQPGIGRARLPKCAEMSLEGSGPSESTETGGRPARRFQATGGCRWPQRDSEPSGFATQDVRVPASTDGLQWDQICVRFAPFQATGGKIRRRRAVHSSVTHHILRRQRGGSMVSNAPPLRSASACTRSTGVSP